MIASLKSICRPSYWSLVPLSILAIALAARVVASTADTLNGDSYILMIGVEKPFSEYSMISGFSLPLKIHYWVSYRVLGSSLFGYMLLPLISSLATLLVVYWGLRRYWHSTLSICFFTLVVLVFNVHSIFLASYSMFTYANSLLVSACLYFLFLRLSMGRLTRRQWIWVVACIIPAAFFSNVTIVVPAATGVFSVIVVRWWQSPDRRSVKDIWRSLVEMWPLTIFPLTYLARYMFYTHQYWGVIQRAQMDWLFLDRSQYPHSFWGATEFFLNNSERLFKSLLRPDIPVDFVDFVMESILAVIGIIVIILIVRLIQRGLDLRVTFTLVFIVVTFSAIAVGGLLGLYPFGSARYAFYLLIPVAVVIGYVASLVLEWTLPRIRAVANSKVLPVMLAAIILVSGAYVNVQKYNSNSAVKTRNHAALQEIKNSNADLVLLSLQCFPAVAVMAPDLYRSAYQLGLGLRSDPNYAPVPDWIVEAVVTTDEQASVKSILVIDYRAVHFTYAFPNWADFIAIHFNLVSSISASAIWAGYYEKK